VQSCEILTQAKPDLKILIPVVNRQRKIQVESFFANHALYVDYRIVIGHARQVMIAADAVLLASGTATLEAMLCKRPMVAAYRLNKLTHLMMKWLYKAKYFALPNVLADDKVVPELLQEEVNAQTISELLLPMLSDDNVQQQLNAKFTELHLALKKNADVQAADAVLQLIEAK
jgi:lipid-A-disaccharide synthase